MPTVLIVSPDFAPSSLPSANRARLLARHLPQFGWEPVVITTAPEFYTNAGDPENLKLIPSGLEVIRTRALPARIARRFGISDVGMRSLFHHWRAIRDVCHTRKVDLLFITVPPYVPMVLGRIARYRLGLPYVIDYQDPWITETWWQVPRPQRPPKWPLAYALARVLEPVALRRASHITAVSEGTAREVLDAYPELIRLGSTEIPFGAEAEDFELLRKVPGNNRYFQAGDGHIHIVYTGVCTPRMSGALRCLFAGFERFRSRQPDQAGRIRFHFVGTDYAPGGGVEKVAPIAAEFGLGSFVEEFPTRVPYLESIQLMLDADCLLVLGTDEPHYSSSKIFPYALARRPILGIMNEASRAVGDLRIMTSAWLATFGHGGPDASTIETVAGYLRQACETNVKPAPANLGDHTAESMARRLAAVFDGVVHASGSRR